VKYETRHDWTITRDGKDMVSLHRCLTGPGGANPAGAEREDINELVKKIVAMLNQENQ
jgi:hypothetical protein